MSHTAVHVGVQQEDDVTSARVYARSLHAKPNLGAAVAQTVVDASARLQQEVLGPSDVHAAPARNVPLPIAAKPTFLPSIASKV